MKKFTSANFVYMFRRVFRREGNGFLTTEHVYIICGADFFILWVPVHRFDFNTLSLGGWHTKFRTHNFAILWEWGWGYKASGKVYPYTNLRV